MSSPLSVSTDSTVSTQGTTHASTTNTIIGRVLSFHSRKGYGKILGEDKKQYFVHYTHLKSEHPPIRADAGWHNVLYTGEYVSFTPSTTDKGIVATQVTGINGGPLMCSHAAWKIVQYRNKRPRRPKPKPETTRDTQTQRRRILTRPDSKEEQHPSSDEEQVFACGTQSDTTAMSVEKVLWNPSRLE